MNEDVRITLLTGRAHIKHTEGGDFRQATYRAIRQGLKSATVALLEPWYRFILDVPSSLIGRALSDLSGMHAETGDPVITESRARLEGRVPVSRITSYVTELNAYTHGEVVNDNFYTVGNWQTCWFIFAGYALVVGVLFALIFKDTTREGN